MSLMYYQEKFANLRMNVSGGRKSPHKVAMLKAVIRLIEEHPLNENRIVYDGALLRFYMQEFDKISSIGDRPNPFLPFFHLNTSGFWHHQVRPAKLQEYKSESQIRSENKLNELVEYAYFDDELFELLQESTVRSLLSISLDANFVNSQEAISQQLSNGRSWTWLEVEACVASYFDMLTLELKGEQYVKAKHRRALLEKVSSRSEGSIEFKYQNISAVLIELGYPYISGYKPKFNYQGMLKNAVLAHIATNDPLINISDDKLVLPSKLVWDEVFDDEVPEMMPQVNEPVRRYLARKVNFSEQESRNRKLGEKGEEFVLELEKQRMIMAGRDDLKDEVEWSSKDRGDGLGYDIRSFDPRVDQELFIEVKTTNSGKYQPFFVSRNEVEFSIEHADQYSLYRVFNFKTKPQFFALEGSLSSNVHLDAQTYKARFR